MFSKLLDLIVDDMILGKKSPPTQAKINYNNPLISYDRPQRTYREHANRMLKKLSFNFAFPKTGKINLAPKDTRINVLLILLFISSASFIFFRPQFFIISFILIGAASRMTQKYFPLIIGLDFCLFFAILVMISYSPLLGMLTGIISSLLGSFLKQVERVEYYLTPVYGFVPVWILMSFSLIPSAGILVTGMLCVAVYIIARFIMIALTYHICIANQLTYISTTLIFNYFLFSSVAPFLISIMV